MTFGGSMSGVATQKYRELIERLVSDRGGRTRGWKAEVAKRLGVHPSYVSRFENEPDIKVGRDAVARACERLGLRESDFWPVPALDEFAAMRALDSMSSEQRARVCAWLVARCAEETKR